MADDLGLLLEEVQDMHHQLLNILQHQGPSWTALPIYEAILQSVQTVWHTPVSCATTPKCAMCYFGAKGTDFLLSRPPLISLVVHAVMESAHQQHCRSTPLDRSAKKMGLLGKKVYFSAGLQFRIANYQALLVKYDFFSVFGV